MSEEGAMSAEAAFAEPKPYPWWLVLINGIATLIIGVLLLTNTASTTIILVQLLALYWVIAGIFSIVSIFVDRTAWGWKLFIGVVGILAGWGLLGSLVIGAVLVLNIALLILGIQGLILGIVALIQAFQGAGWGAGIMGVISIFLGIVLLSMFDTPLINAVIVARVAGIFAIVGGIVGIIQSFRVRSAAA